MTAVHILNVSPCVPLKFDTPERVCSGKDVSYDHLKVFGCKAFVHIPKDERSKLDVKTRQCVFIGYGQDQLGYRFYDPVQKKLVKSRDAVFIEDETIEDIEKAQKNASRSSNSRTDQVMMPPAMVPREGGDGGNDQPKTGDTDAPIEFPLDDSDDDGVHNQPPAPMVSPELRRSTRVRQPSTRYPTNQYVLLTDGGEPKDFEEAMDDEHKRKWIEAMQDEMRSLHKNETFELVKLPKGKRALKNKWVFKIKHEEHNH